jgi:Spy/CpxP family protein refolding chaperone
MRPGKLPEPLNHLGETRIEVFVDDTHGVYSTDVEHWRSSNKRKGESIMKRTSLQSLIVFLAVTGMVGFGQKHEPPDPAQMVQHRVNFLTEKLGLSTAQQQQATTIFTNALGNQQSLRGQMKAAHDGLESAISRNDSAAIDQAANSIANLMAQSIAAHAKADAAFYQTLTPDQQSKYSQMETREPGGWGMRQQRGGGPPF